MNADQFLRITRLLGEDVVESLHQKTVTVVGLGAVGGTCLESLVRSGIGHVRLVDFDTVGITNLNRQILATYDTLGQQKTEVAKARMHAINPDCEVEILSLFVQDETLNLVLDPKTDLVVDAIDSLGPKCALLQAAYERNLPIVSSMGAALRRDPSLIRTADLMDTFGCPLARQVRSNLRKRGVKEGIKAVFSPERVRFTYLDPQDDFDPDAKDQVQNLGRKRNILGSLPTITSIFGQTLAHIALERLIGGDVFKGEPVCSVTPKR
ncbi:dinucleotide-utilizing enzyme possibly involved in molybdopterin or thiamin biosynthesis [Sphaerochaeta pleomorpha str. Grapes]|uniref:Dinucleotide-utilizing enzyme possibly involved in molybdopterin or thiamin biosynthesis n=1 Tax=Sphaerochaeta pleomorpha (strain ATCC BAA-1885 / DSM 22778 / Grapes) TaxID=158190 RepID=G8QYN4_SPHPG|nr:tRNA threonylcarbamoyladenosine dehydratase [Sphaerochaeta pleomorpha]AEV28597.1 dinucleotide-utilizing enzyme possibly involved in molybdopterin or thiamin biosynthesis [Sphaerochaeta pleomorpha str. Grapes]